MISHMGLFLTHRRKTLIHARGIAVISEVKGTDWSRGSASSANGLLWTRQFHFYKHKSTTDLDDDDDNRPKCARAPQPAAKSCLREKRGFESQPTASISRPLPSSYFTNRVSFPFTSRLVCSGLNHSDGSLSWVWVPFRRGLVKYIYCGQLNML